MEKRMIEFVRALRAAGIRISLAESQDALDGVGIIGITDQDYFRMALRTTLVKEHHDQSVFDYFYPLFFSSYKPPLENINDQLTQEEQALLQDAMQSFMGKMDALRQLLNAC